MARRIGKGFIKFTAVGIVSAIIIGIVLYIFSDMMGYPAWLTAWAYTPFGYVWRYWVNKKWVFK